MLRACALRVLAHINHQAPRRRVEAGQHFAYVLEVRLGGAQDELILHAADAATGRDQRAYDRDHLLRAAILERNYFQLGSGRKAHQPEQRRQQQTAQKIHIPSSGQDGPIRLTHSLAAGHAGAMRIFLYFLVYIS